MSEIKYEMPNIKNDNVDIEHVTKRDGTLAPFDGSKIYNAILKAGTSTGEFSEQEAWLLTAKVLKVVEHKFSESLPSIEQIQDETLRNAVLEAVEDDIWDNMYNAGYNGVNDGIRDHLENLDVNVNITLATANEANYDMSSIIIAFGTDYLSPEYEMIDASYLDNMEQFEQAAFTKVVTGKDIFMADSDTVNWESGYLTACNNQEIGMSSLVLGGGRETKESEIDLTVGIRLQKHLLKKMQVCHLHRII